MRYFAAIEMPTDSNTAYGVVVPDVPGCFSAGDTFEEALENAKEALVMQLEDMLERGLELPVPSPPEDIARAHSGWTISDLEINPSQLSGKAIRVNITIPEWLLHDVDKRAGELKMNRSAFLADAAIDRIKKIA